MAARGLAVRMNYLDVCSGISAPTAAWRSLGWKAIAYSEIEKAPCAVLAHHYPETPNLGDMTKYKEWPDYADVDVLVGGTPCQSYSIAGLRAGLDDPRGQLMLVYLAIARRYRPRWMVWENVPGVLSSNGGRDFGTFLGGLAELGYGFAYRVLDAGYYGCLTPRPRVFVVAHSGDWRAAAEALFDRESFAGDKARNREQAQAKGAPAVFTARGGMAHDDRSNYILDEHGLRTSTPREWERALGYPDEYTYVPYPALCKVRGGEDGNRLSCSQADKTRQAQLVQDVLQRESESDSASERKVAAETEVATSHAVPGDAGMGAGAASVASRPLCHLPEADEPYGDRSQSRNEQSARLALSWLQHKTASSGAFGLAQRRPSISRQVRVMADGPRYKMLGNSMCVNVMRSIGERIAMVDKLPVELTA